jgi:hypothetical protein
MEFHLGQRTNAVGTLAAMSAWLATISNKNG